MLPLLILSRSPFGRAESKPEEGKLDFFSAPSVPYAKRLPVDRTFCAAPAGATQTALGVLASRT